MVVLKKIKASSLMETLVATVLIVIVFMLASLTLNNILYNSTRKETGKINVHINELHYNYIHKQIEVPYYSSFKGWKVSIEKNEEDKLLYLEAKHSETNKIIERKIKAFD
ncbi:hypothetical protein [Pseudofulvibacter geojedonensis]|uniref:Type II secretion system protein n=1 Tax=Pseudofulvibacter geojedonensis TaxID=1123758 RepID=A0ABW3I293_9FLAO